MSSMEIYTVRTPVSIALIRERERERVARDKSRIVVNRQTSMGLIDDPLQPVQQRLARSTDKKELQATQQ